MRPASCSRSRPFADLAVCAHAATAQEQAMPSARARHGRPMRLQAKSEAKPAAQWEASPCGPVSGRTSAAIRPFGPGPEAHQDELPRPQLGEAEAAQRLHVHEDVGGALAPRQKTETTQPVEPFHLRPFETARRRDRNMGARWRHLRGMDRGRLVHREDAEGLQPFRPRQRLPPPRARLRRLSGTVAAQAGHVQQDIRHAVVRHDEAESLRHIEPLDDTGKLDEICRRCLVRLH